MRPLIILAGIALLILGLILGVALTRQPTFTAIESAVMADDGAARGEGAAGAAHDEQLLFIGQPAEESADDAPQTLSEENQAEARKTAEALMARLEAIREQTNAAQSEPEPVAQDEAQPAGETADLSADQMSTAQQLVDDLLAAAQNLKTLLNGEGETEAAPASENTGITGGLQGQLQSLLDAFNSSPPTSGPQPSGPWMPGEPDCEADPAPGVNWSQCDKSGIVLNGADLQGAILKETIFDSALISGTDFSGAYLGGADFSNATLQSVLMRKALLKETQFISTTVNIADISYAQATDANFSQAAINNMRALHSELVHANFQEAIINNSDFSFAYLNKADFSDAILQMSFFNKSQLIEANFSGAQVDFVDFLAARIYLLDLSEADLSFSLFKNALGTPVSSVDLSADEIICPDGTYVQGQVTSDAASLCDWIERAEHEDPPTPPETPDCAADPAPGVNWSGCDLTGINLIGVDLHGANLSGANLSAAFIYMSDLWGADLSGADLTGALITLSYFGEGDLSGANLSDAQIESSFLSGANFNLADLTAVLLSSVKMQHADLTEVTLSEATILNSFLGYSDLSGATADNITILNTFLTAANLTGTDLSLALDLSGLDLSKAQIEELDLSAAVFNFSNWLKEANGVPTSSEDLTVNELLICPAGEPVFGPLTTDAASLCTWTECWAGIIDGDFEAQHSAWIIPQTEYPAQFSQEQANSPDWSVRTGIVDPQDNIKSFSSVRQQVTIPAGTHPVILTFSLYTQTEEGNNFLIPKTLEEAQLAGDANAIMGGHGSRFGDAQWVIILDEHGRELLRPISMRSNTQEWEEYSIDLSKLAHPEKDRTIEVYFGTFNNGRDGVTAMYVDDVYLGSCPGVPAPPPPPPPPVVCTDIILNGGFEVEGADWILPQTPYPAQFSNQQVYTGTLAMQTGISNTVNIESFSSAVQKITIPKDATEANLEFYLYPRSEENDNLLLPNSMEEVLAPSGRAMNFSDAQWALLLNQNGWLVETLVSMRSNDQTWEPYTFDLLPYKGHPLLLYFSTYNNGRHGQTAMFVDEVSLTVCAPEEEQPLTALSELERTD